MKNYSTCMSCRDDKETITMFLTYKILDHILKRKYLLVIASMIIFTSILTADILLPEYFHTVGGSAGIRYVPYVIQDNVYGCGTAQSSDIGVLTVLEFLWANMMGHDLTRPENIGVMGSAHEHAAILVKIHNDTFGFSSSSFQIRSSFIHFEGGDGTTIHKHATGVTLGYLFETMDMYIDDQSFVFPHNTRHFCTNDDYTLKYFVNERQVSDIRDYEIADDDRILIIYGSETRKEIDAYLLELKNLRLVR